MRFTGAECCAVYDSGQAEKDLVKLKLWSSRTLGSTMLATYIVIYNDNVLAQMDKPQRCHKDNDPRTLPGNVWASNITHTAYIIKIIKGVPTATCTRAKVAADANANLIRECPSSSGPHEAPLPDQSHDQNHRRENILRPRHPTEIDFAPTQ